MEVISYLPITKRNDLKHSKTSSVYQLPAIQQAEADTKVGKKCKCNDQWSCRKGCINNNSFGMDSFNFERVEDMYYACAPFPCESGLRAFHSKFDTIKVLEEFSNSESDVDSDHIIENDQKDSLEPKVFEKKDEKGKPIIGAQCIEHHEKRTKVVGFRTETFPLLDFLGFWNGTRFSSDKGTLFPDHLGIHIHQEDVEVSIPDTLVDELANFWSHRYRDSDLKEFSVSAAKCKKMLSECDVSAAQQAQASLYAPAIAYLKYWETQQNISRVVSGAFLRNSLKESVIKSWNTIRFYKLAILLFLLFGFSSFLGSHIQLVEPEMSWRAHLETFGLFVPTFSMYHKFITDVQSPLGEHYSQVFLINRQTYNNYVYDIGCTNWKFDYIHYQLSVEQPSCFDYQFQSISHISMKMWNKLMHSINGNLVVPVIRELVNCARLGVNKIKQGAKLCFVDDAVRGNIHFKDFENKKGRHATCGFDTEFYAPTGFASNAHNELEALKARVLAQTIQPIEAELNECIVWCKKNHRKLFPKMYNIKSVSFDVYLARSNASPSVKRILRATYDRLVSEGVDEDFILSGRDLRVFTTRSSFVKVENNLYTTIMGTKDKAPRLIQGATPEFICLVGPWMMACQDLLKKRWNKNNNLFFTSGSSAEDTADFITQDSNRKILEDDLGKFDCSIQEPWCKYEIWICEQFGAPRAVLDLMRANIQTHGYTLHGWKYSCLGTRKSGDPYTSLMNSVINGLSHLHLYCKWTGRSVENAKFNIKMLLQGDDNLMTHTEKVEFPWRQGMAGLGFDSEAIYRKDFESAEFCSNRLYPIERGYIFGPMPGKVLAKFGYIINPPPGVKVESLMRGVALGLRKNCNYIPPIRAVIDRILFLTEGHQAYYQRNFQEHVLKTSHLYDETVEVLLCLDEQYYWSCHMQSDFEKTLSNLQLGDAYNCSYADMLFDRDTSGPKRIF